MINTYFDKSDDTKEIRRRSVELAIDASRDGLSDEPLLKLAKQINDFIQTGKAK